ncbi:putative oxidoreductase [Trypanosoma rangeli]|uniref:Putative oxidoreductase n=1 Tax=Trypanosoma rangeli TaxID=5698 RepID=A0A422NUQ9_TRYRA|nr:putative oxidoreductase [Trypanosoma rangeli]RNF09188.1 putative oxidoreductase [Trypanosoma rangeli]|eukprot:RNF09188.1 putative oxidoreductase [Trypanosoma rangeli]
MEERAPKRPREPAPSDCCGSGCSRCVWDVYFDELARYEEYAKGSEAQAIELDEDEEDETGSSSDDDNDETHNFVGSVVIKYIDVPTNKDAVITPMVALSRILGHFSPICDARVVMSSSSHLVDGNVLQEDQDHAVEIVDVLLDNRCRPGEPMNSVLPIPGDVAEIFVPNDYDVHRSGYYGEVEKLCAHLNLNPNQWCEIHRSPFVPSTHFPPWLPLQCPVQIWVLLAYFVDISSCGYLLRPAFFQTLLRLAMSNQTHQPLVMAERGAGSMKLLEHCASKEVAPFIYKKIMNGGSALCYPHLIDMFHVFPFVKLPLARLLEVSGPLRPRRFSVANYTLDDSSAEGQPRSIQLCLRRVDISKVTVDNSGE